MNITHDHIRSIVGTEPQEWWPEDVGFHTGVWVDREYYATISPITAYHAFVGAAVEWLGKRGTVGVDGVDPTFGVVWKSEDRVSRMDSTCLLSALVRAIGEVK